MPSISDVLAAVDGMRSDTERRLEAQFPTVASLSAARREDLEEIKGVGRVLSGRILMAAARAQATVTDSEAATKAAKDSTAAGMAVATEVIDAAGKVAGKVTGRSDSASQMVKDAGIAAKTGIYRLHASSDDAIDKTAGVVEKVAEVAGEVGKAVTRPARKVIKGVRGRDHADDD